jgi:glycosyltransferase involved in cell wall biosynthesis
MATYNGSQYIRASINSILSQTHRDLELIIGDDCSTDDTAHILAGYHDRRVRVIRNDTNLGVVATRNRCFAQAAGAYVAMLDHDDISRPTRIAKQLAYLQANPGTVLVGTAGQTLEDGVLSSMWRPKTTTPDLICWLLHIANPLTCSSVMFRADVVRQLGVFMREDYIYADDYDFYHRMMPMGAIAQLDEELTIYRLHSLNASKRHRDIMIRNATNVLVPSFTALFGAKAVEAASLIVRHLSAGEPVPDEASLERLHYVFATLNCSFLERSETTDATREAIRLYAEQIWRRAVSATVRRGVMARKPSDAYGRIGLRLNRSWKTRFLLKRLRLKDRVRSLLHSAVRSSGSSPAGIASCRLFDTVYEPCLPDPEQLPTLFVSVDTEAEFDWTKPFTRNLTSVSAMDDVERGQAVFDRYGLRPIYLVDFPIASQPVGYQKLRTIMERDGCEIGAHLHPWTTPPFKEQLSNHNSYPGNLDQVLEEQKLANLVEMIRSNFGISPVFYKAGRYGVGRATAAALVRHGIKIDLSVLPGADLRPQGGPDFRLLRPVPYRIAGTNVLTVPMTRSDVGLMPSWGRLNGIVRKIPGGARLPLPAVLARLRIAESITLSPEGITAEEQIRLVRVLLRRGYRQFVLHYHSPSLSPGHTPYARNCADVESLVGRLREVCRFFFEQVGGLPGYPRDLLQVLACD